MFVLKRQSVAATASNTIFTAAALSIYEQASGRNVGNKPPNTAELQTTISLPTVASVWTIYGGCVSRELAVDD